MNVPWSFEYVDISYELDYLHPERSEAVDVKHFVSVLEVFKHLSMDEGRYKTAMAMASLPDVSMDVKVMAIFMDNQGD